MAQLTITLVGRTVEVHELDRDRITIGRRPNNDIHIDNLAISGYHAVIHRTEEGYVIEDVGSTNGTIVNEETIQRHILRAGDVIKIGKHELLYSDYTNPINKVKTETVAANKNSSPTANNAANDTFHNAADNVNLPPAAIKILNGSRRGTELQLNHARTNLGRPGSPSAVITRSQRGYIINAVEANEQVLINDSPVSADHLLENRDVIEIAGFQVEFYYLA